MTGTLAQFLFSILQENGGRMTYADILETIELHSDTYIDTYTVNQVITALIRSDIADYDGEGILLQTGDTTEKTRAHMAVTVTI